MTGSHALVLWGSICAGSLIYHLARQGGWEDFFAAAYWSGAGILACYLSLSLSRST